MPNLPRCAGISTLSFLLAVGCDNSPTTPTPPPVECTFSAAPTSASLPAAGGTVAVAVTTQATCAWTAATTAQWLAATPTSGTGSGTTNINAQPNTATQPRTGFIVVAGVTVTVQQDWDVSACTYQVSPVQLSICMAWTTDLTSTITTQDGCPWTAVSTAGWMPVTDGASGTGSGIVRLRGTDNYDAPRSGTVQVRWPTVTAGQNIAVAQAGCFYAITQSVFTIPVAGGTGRFDVLQQADPNSCGGPLQNACVWTSVSDASWITITSPTTRTGDEAVTFTVSANTTGVARTGTITVRDKVVQINQAGG